MTDPLVPVTSAPVPKTRLKKDKFYDVYTISGFEGRGRFYGKDGADVYLFELFVTPDGHRSRENVKRIVGIELTFKPVPASYRAPSRSQIAGTRRRRIRKTRKSRA